MRHRLIFLITLLTATLALASGTGASAVTGKRPCLHKILRVGNRGECVRSAKWLLTGKKPGPRRLGRYWHIRPDRKMTLRFNKTTGAQTRTAKYRLGYPPKKIVGSFGPRLRRYLLGHAPVPLKWRITAGKRRVAWEKHRAALKRARSARGKYDKLIGLANHAINLRQGYGGYRLFYYTQSSHRTDFSNFGHLPPPKMGGDCSASIAGLYHIAGVPGLAPWDWTGSMQARGPPVWHRGQSLSLLHPGDLIFYGSAPNFHHVTMYLGSGLVYSFGSDSCPCKLPVLYRSDAVLARRVIK